MTTRPARLLPIWSRNPTQETACTRLAMSRATVYERIAAGQLRTVTDGRKRFVTDDMLADYIAALPVSPAVAS